jgi:trimeric autotransporter adhesin
MRTYLFFTRLAVYLLLLGSGWQSAWGQVPSQIHYQGRLVDGSNLVNGTVGLSMFLLDAATGGSLLYGCSNDVTVVDGLYHAYLGENTLFGNLGEALAQPEVWLQVVVNGVVLTPRERLVSVPYARMVEGLLVGTNRNVTINPGLSPLNPLSILNVATGYGAVVGGGNENQADGFSATISGGQNNIAEQSYASIGGGFGNRASGIYATIGGGAANAVTNHYGAIAGGSENNAGQSATIGGGLRNHATGERSTIAGGASNRAYAAHATVGGGVDNVASNEWSTVGGGSQNRAQGDVATVAGGTFNRANALWTSIGGGALNLAAGLGASVGGGYSGIASGSYARVSGGFQNAAVAAYATVPGGYQNRAGGVSSMAAGYRAQALHNGTFVWADSTSADFSSTDTNQFLIRADGGVGINTVSPLAPLHVFGVDPGGQFSGQFMISGTTDTGVSNSGAGLRLAGNDGNGPREWGFIRALKANSTVGNTQSYMSFGTRLHGGSLTERMRLDTAGLRVNGTFVSSSDRAKKQDIAPADPQVILERLAAVPVHYWRYRDDPGTLHVGPMAQDFHAAFGVGPDERHITTLDADGVALAAIQALAQQVTLLAEENALLRTELDTIKQHLGGDQGRGDRGQP